MDVASGTSDRFGDIGARLDQLTASRAIWTRVILLSLGGCFEYYDLFLTGYIAPGLVRSGILTPTTPGLFGTSGVASFVAALFAGLFVGTALFGFVADRFGRKTIFTYSLIWYTIASVVMAFQSDAFGLNLWRFIAGVGIGVELVTIDAYIAELVPAALRGRAFAYNSAVQFVAVPVVALVAWLLVPIAPLGMDGWRWVVLDRLPRGGVRLGDPFGASRKPALARPAWTDGRGRSRAFGARTARRAPSPALRREAMASKRTRGPEDLAKSGKVPISCGP